ncbi:mitochondrial ribosomal protein subunit L20-domain-containing protein [Mycena sp. CBHHK59/15]|nr:mitochondrial ribosomal protein subunit L20-domain-containing protein [Mycena sp. CBHHK59/15]
MYACYATKWPRPKPGTAERPAYHAPDPLINNPKAVVTELPDEELTFIHRPPPTAPSPFSYSTNPVSPLLQPRAPQEDVPLPPLFSRSDRAPLLRASLETMTEIRRLRALDPDRYTVRMLAKRFKVAPNFVSAIAALKKTQRRAKRQAYNLQVEKAREGWSERRVTQKMIQVKRRELW